MEKIKNLGGLLADLKFDDEAIIESIEHEGSHQRLYALGIYPGQKIRIINQGGNSKVISINEGLCRYMIGAKLAKKIVIKRTEY